LVRIDVDKSASHQQSQNDIGGDNRFTWHEKRYSQNQKSSNLNMGYGSRDKPVHKSGAGFVDARLEELRRRWENATDEREKNEVSEQIREWQSFRPERSASAGNRR